MADFWACRGKNKVGPFLTREEAIEAFRKAFPFKGSDYAARATRNDITTGYGLGGPWFDVHWAKARG